MTTSTHSTRRLATLAVIAGLAATLAPLANAGYPRCCLTSLAGAWVAQASVTISASSR